MNRVFLRGRLSRPAQQRVLESGTVIVNYEVTVTRDDGPADTVPVMWADPPANAGADAFDAGDEVVVVGRVRRRFFRAGGGTQSRTEVVADVVVAARRTRKVASLLESGCEEVLM